MIIGIYFKQLIPMMRTTDYIKLSKWIYIIDSDNDGDIIVGYRQHVLHNNKLDHSDTDNDIPYHIHDLVRLTHLQQRVGLQATIINGSRYPANHVQRYLLVIYTVHYVQQ